MLQQVLAGADDAKRIGHEDAQGCESASGLDETVRCIDAPKASSAVYARASQISQGFYLALRPGLVCRCVFSLVGVRAHVCACATGSSGRVCRSARRSASAVRTSTASSLHIRWICKIFVGWQRPSCQTRCESGWPAWQMATSTRKTSRAATMSVATGATLHPECRGELTKAIIKNRWEVVGRVAVNKLLRPKWHLTLTDMQGKQPETHALGS